MAARVEQGAERIGHAHVAESQSGDVTGGGHDQFVEFPGRVVEAGSRCGCFEDHLVVELHEELVVIDAGSG